MAKEKISPSVRGLEWLVQARNKIQELLLTLYKSFCADTGAPTANLTKEQHLMLGAAFSLWRAVFLVPPENTKRDAIKLGKDAVKYLHKIITTNAIVFGDDHRWSVWAGGYYLRNAIFRINQINGTQQQVVDEELTEAVLRDRWNKAYEELKRLVNSE